MGELLLHFLAFGLEDVLFLFVYLLFELLLFTAEVFEVLLCLMGFGGVWREVLIVGEWQSTEIGCQRQRHLRRELPHIKAFILPMHCCRRLAYNILNPCLLIQHHGQTMHLSHATHQLKLHFCRLRRDLRLQVQFEGVVGVHVAPPVILQELVWLGGGLPEGEVLDVFHALEDGLWLGARGYCFEAAGVGVLGELRLQDEDMGLHKGNNYFMGYPNIRIRSLLVVIIIQRIQSYKVTKMFQKISHFFFPFASPSIYFAIF